MLELDEYQNKGLLWYGCKNDNHICKVSTQYDELDKTLNGGFPAEGIIELKTPLGIGELRLLFPYLVNKQKAEKQECVFIAPPIQLNAEFLLANGLELTSTLILPVYDEKKALWATEQALSSGCCSTVVLWQTQLSIKQVRRLMLACERGGASLVLIRYTHLQNQKVNHYSNISKTEFLSLPSALSLSLFPDPSGIKVKVDKQKGGTASKAFVVDMNQKWGELTTVGQIKLSNESNNVIAFPNIVNN